MEYIGKCVALLLLLAHMGLVGKVLDLVGKSVVQVDLLTHSKPSKFVDLGLGDNEVGKSSD